MIRTSLIRTRLICTRMIRLAPTGIGMVPQRLHYGLAAALVAALAVAGCKKQEQPAVVAPPVADTPLSVPAPAPAAGQASVTSVDLGNAVGADNRVVAPMSTFGADDTIYTTVTTTGSANGAALMVRWTYQDGQVVGTETKTLSTSAPMTTEFHASNPDGWPAGKYKAEVMLNGALVQSRDFEVR